MSKVKPTVLIQTIRESFIGAEQVYMNGSCVMFYKILHSVFPEARPYWSKEHRHMVAKIGRFYYDITGQVVIDKSYYLDSESYCSIYIATAFPRRGIKYTKRYSTARRLY